MSDQSYRSTSHTTPQQVMGTNASTQGSSDATSSTTTTLARKINEQNFVKLIFTDLALRLQGAQAKNEYQRERKITSMALLQTIRLAYKTSVRVALAAGNAPLVLANYQHDPAEQVQELEITRLAMVPTPPTEAVFEDANLTLMNSVLDMCNNTTRDIHFTPDTNIIRGGNGLAAISILLRNFCDLDHKTREAQKRLLTDFKIKPGATIQQTLNRLQLLEQYLVVEMSHTIPTITIINTFTRQLDAKNPIYSNLIPKINEYLQANPTGSFTKFKVFLKTAVKNANLDINMPIHMSTKMPAHAQTSGTAMVAETRGNRHEEHKTDRQDPQFPSDEICCSEISDAIWADYKNRNLTKYIIDRRKELNFRSKKQEENRRNKMLRHGNSNNNDGRRNNHQNGRRQNRRNNDSQYDTSGSNRRSSNYNNNDNNYSNGRQDRYDNQDRHGHGNRYDNNPRRHRSASRPQEDPAHNRRTQNRNRLQQGNYMASYGDFDYQNGTFDNTFDSQNDGTNAYDDGVDFSDCYVGVTTLDGKHQVDAPAISEHHQRILDQIRDKQTIIQQNATGARWADAADVDDDIEEEIAELRAELPQLIQLFSFPHLHVTSKLSSLPQTTAVQPLQQPNDVSTCGMSSRGGLLVNDDNATIPKHDQHNESTIAVLHEQGLAIQLQLYNNTTVTEQLKEILHKAGFTCSEFMTNVVMKEIFDKDTGHTKYCYITMSNDQIQVDVDSTALWMEIIRELNNNSPMEQNTREVLQRFVDKEDELYIQYKTYQRQRKFIIPIFHVDTSDFISKHDERNDCATAEAYTLGINSNRRLALLDSAASIAVEPDKSRLRDVRSCRPLQLTGVAGTIRLKEQGKWSEHLPGIFHAPHMKVALVPVTYVTSTFGGKIIFDNTHATYVNQQEQVQTILATLDPKTRQYVVDESVLHKLARKLPNISSKAAYNAEHARDGSAPFTSISPTKGEDKTIILHQQLQHPSKTKMLEMLKQGCFNEMNTKDDEQITTNSINRFQCIACYQGKSKRNTFSKRTLAQRKNLSQQHKLGGYMSTDIAGPFTPSYQDKYTYYMIVYDTGTRMIFTRCLQDKKSVTLHLRQIFNEMKALVPNIQFGTLKMDQDSTFVSKQNRRMLAEYKIHPSLAVPHQHQSNGSAEVLIRICNDKIRTSLSGAYLPSQFWSFALRSNVHALNQQPHFLLPDRMSPIENATGQQPKLTLITFGAQLFYQVPKELKKNGTFDTSGRPGIYLGHSDNRKTIQILDLLTGSIVNRRDAIVQPDTRPLDKDRISKAIAGENLMTYPGNDKEATLTAGGYGTLETSPATTQQVDIPQINDLRRGPGRTPKDANGVTQVWSGRDGKYVSPDSNVQSSSHIPDRSQFTRRIIGDNVSSQRPQDTPEHIPTAHSTRSRRKQSMQANPRTNPHAFNLRPGKSEISPEDASGAFKATITNVHGNNLPPTPATLAKALTGPDAAMWNDAAEVEASKFIQYKTFNADPDEVRRKLADGAKIVHLVDVLTLKTDAYGRLLKGKYRACANGKHEHNKFDAHRQASSPVVDSGALALLLAFAVFMGFSLLRADCENAYLNVRETDSRVVRVSHAFMSILMRLGFHNPTGSLLLSVCTGLYGYDDTGLKFLRLVWSVLTQVGFTQCAADPCIWQLAQGDSIILTCTHVDDFLFAHNSDAFFLPVLAQIQEFLKFGVVAQLDSFLGVTFEKTPRGYLQSTESLIDVAVRASRQTNSHPLYHPFRVTDEIDDDTSSPEELAEYNRSISYRSLIGLVAYITQKTRQDALFHTNTLSSKQNNTNVNDYKLLLQLIQYLGTTKHYRRSIERPITDSQGEPFNSRGGKCLLVAYADADYAGRKTDRKSVSGSYVMLSHETLHPHEGIPVEAKANAQQTIAQSSNESELVSGNTAAKRLVFLNEVLKFFQGETPPAKLYMDNEGAIAIAHGIGRTRRSKHIEVKHFYIRELIQNKKITLHSIDTHDNVADAMTKSLGKIKFRKFRRLLGIVDPTQRHDNE